MASREPLSFYTTRDTVNNIVVFISDSLRYDELPEAVANRGIKAHTVSASTFTGSSIPSMFTGRYPTKHRIWDFSDRLPERPAIFDAVSNTGYDVRGIWSWPLTVLRLDVPDWEVLKDRRLLPDIPEPFVYVLHDKGGHVPYGSPTEDWNSASEFFACNQDPITLRSLYREGIETSTSVLFELLEILKERKILEETLVVFTSDHGELLGSRGGLYGHGIPLVPELIRVPTVFLGAGLPAGKEYPSLISSVDLAPTLLGALGVSMRPSADGINIWERDPDPERCLQSHIWQEQENHPLNAQYQASGVWDASGGYVVHHNRFTRRCGSAIGQYFGEFGDVNRSCSPLDMIKVFINHLPKTRKYGDPAFNSETARRNVPSDFHSQDTIKDVTPDEDQLQKLGYL